MTEYPDSFEDSEEFKGFWNALPGRSKHILRRFKPGRALRLSEDYPKYANFTPHPVIGWIHGVTSDKPPKILFLPVHPGVMSRLLKDGVIDLRMQQALTSQYSIPIEPEYLEELPP